MKRAGERWGARKAADLTRRRSALRSLHLFLASLRLLTRAPIAESRRSPVGTPQLRRTSS